MPSPIDPAQVEALLAHLYLAGGSPRKEERKKAREVADLLAVLREVLPQPAPRGRPRLLVDAAAGHGYVGLCAAALLGWRRVVAVERDATRAARVQAAAARLPLPLELEVRVRAADASAIPEAADVVIALHACGPATDAILDGATAAGARWILCAPCCYGEQISGYAAAEAEADSLGLGGDAALRTRFAAVRVDAARLERLRAAGYEAALRAFTAPTTSPHHLLFRARRGGR